MVAKKKAKKKPAAWSSVQGSHGFRIAVADCIQLDLQQICSHSEFQLNHLALEDL